MSSRKCKILLTLLFCNLFYTIASAQEFAHCTNPKWGYAIDCDLSWPVKSDSFQENFIIDSTQQKMATMTITVAPDSQLKLEDLTSPVL